MRLQTSPLFWDIDAGGNDAPTVTPGAGAQPVTFNLSSLDGRTEDLWNYVQATWLHINFSVDQTSGATECPRDRLFPVIQSVNMKSQVLGDVLSAFSNDGPALGLIDQVVGAGYQFPTPFADEISDAGNTTNCDLYLRIPHELDVYGRPADGGIWAPIFEKGKLVINIAPATTAFATGTTLADDTVTVKAAFEISPLPVPQLHTPSKFVKYEFNTGGTQLKLESFGGGDGMNGINPGARLAMLLWLSNALNGGVDGVDNWASYSLPWRHQKVTNNPDVTLGSFLATIKRGAGAVAGAGTPVLDFGRWPYQASSTDVANSLLDEKALFMPFVWPGQDMNLSASQKQVGDLQILAGWASSPPNGTHLFRTLEHYSWQASTIAKLMGMMGYDTRAYTCEPKTHDNTDPRLISDGQLWGLPLRVVKRGLARKPVI